MSRNMNRRFFAEFLTLLSRRVNPDPNVDDDEENEDILKQMQKPKTNSVMDLTGNDELRRLQNPRSHRHGSHVKDPGHVQQESFKIPQQALSDYNLNQTCRSHEQK